MKSNKTLYLIPVMFCFFAMGFVDLVGIASNYVKEDLSLSDSVANIFPSLVFFWFLIFSVPTGMLMNKIGRKKTVLLSLIVTVVSLFLPLLGETFPIMLIAFSLLGIGNALMQTSLNPLVSSIIGGSNIASTLTFGQFIKAIASFLAPYLAGTLAVGKVVLYVSVVCLSVTCDKLHTLSHQFEQGFQKPSHVIGILMVVQIAIRDDYVTMACIRNLQERILFVCGG